MGKFIGKYEIAIIAVVAILSFLTYSTYTAQPTHSVTGVIKSIDYLPTGYAYVQFTSGTEVGGYIENVTDLHVGGDCALAIVNIDQENAFFGQCD